MEKRTNAMIAGMVAMVLVVLGACSEAVAKSAGEESPQEERIPDDLFVQVFTEDGWVQITTPISDVKPLLLRWHGYDLSLFKLVVSEDGVLEEVDPGSCTGWDGKGKCVDTREGIVFRVQDVYAEEEVEVCAGHILFLNGVRIYSSNPWEWGDRGERFSSDDNSEVFVSAKELELMGRKPECLFVAGPEDLFTLDLGRGAYDDPEGRWHANFLRLGDVGYLPVLERLSNGMFKTVASSDETPNGMYSVIYFHKDDLVKDWRKTAWGRENGNYDIEPDVPELCPIPASAKKKGGEIPDKSSL